MTETPALTTDWSVRPYRSGDERAIADLFERTFSTTHSPEHFRWKLDPPWCGVVPAQLAHQRDRLIGQYGGTDVRVWLEGESLRAVHASDAMTDASFRRSGVLTRLGTEAHAAWKRDGAAFVYGLPHEGWGTRRVALGWEGLFHARWMWLPIPGPHPLSSRYAFLERLRSLWEPLLRARFERRLARLRRDSGEVTVQERTPAPSELDAIWERLRERYAAVVVRDAAWVRHRYLESPDRRYRIALAYRSGRPEGYAVFRVRRDRRAWLVDLFTDPTDGHVRDGLFAWMLHHFRRSGVSSVSALATSPGIAASFRRAGFFPAKGRYEVSAVPLVSDPLPAILRNPAKWFTMAGDFDIV